MTMRVNSYVHSSDTLDPDPYSFNVSSRVNSDVQRSSGHGHLPLVPKVEEDDLHHIKILERRLDTCTARSTNQPKELTKREQRKKNEAENDKFTGLRLEELQSERYLRYREKSRQKAKEKNGQGNVWPDFLEHAFQCALRDVQPMGRKKRMCEGKLCGRNELISKRIKELTGVDRDRKKVSSHIQVLRGFMNDNHAWMRHVVSTDNNSTAQVATPSIFPDVGLGTARNVEEKSYARSHYGNIGQTAYSDAPSLPPPGGILRSNAPGQGPYLNRIEFEMFVVSPSKEKFHKYTSNQTDIGALTRALEEVRDWRTSFPLLERYHEQGQLESDIILIESHLDLLAEYPPKNSSLSIRFMVNVTGVSGSERWSTRTEYYENNGHQLDMRKFYAKYSIDKPTSWDTPVRFQGSGQSDVKLEIPLQSTWWVQLFTMMAARKQEWKHDPELSQQEDEWSRRYLQEMSILQELWVNHGDDGTSSSRVAIILWKFSPTRTGEAGTTTWRKLMPPPKRIEINSPSQLPAPPLQHSMILDSALQDLAMPQAVSANTERFLRNSDAIAEDPELIIAEPHSARESASPALSLDYTTSFPSSTSTSFPPSVKHGFLSHEESQESACYSQESDRSRNGSLDGQYSLMYSQKPMYTYEEPRAYDDDLRYLSDNQGLELQDPAYTQESFDNISLFHAQAQHGAYGGEPNHDASFTTHDFIEGQIQLSFQQYELSAIELPQSDSTILEKQHHLQVDGRIENDKLRAPMDDYSAVQPSTVAVDRSQHSDFDFSALDIHLTPEAIESLRMQQHEFERLSEVLSHGSGIYDFAHEGSSKPGESALGRAGQRRCDQTALVQGEHGLVLGEITAEEMDGRVHEMGDQLEIEEEYDHGTQFIGERERSEEVVGGLDYEYHEQREETTC